MKLASESNEQTDLAQENPQPKKKLGYKFWLVLGISLGLGSGAIALGWGWYKLEASLPESVEDVTTYAREGTLTIQAADGTIIREIGPVTHENLKIWQIPEPLVQAFIASEDRRFQEHQGLDYQGVARAVFSNIQAGEVVEGGSTITQQLARIVFLNQDRKLGRKIKEVRLSQKIEQRFNKEQILEHYLNLVYLGSGAYGVADAAWIYFSKPVDELNLAEVATIAGIAPAPSLYSPFENRTAAKKRRNLVLQRMKEDGYISALEAQEAIASPLETNRSQPKRLQIKFPYFTEYIQTELPKYLSPELLQGGGLTVETTLNPTWQEAAEKTIEQAIERYGKWQRFGQAALVAIDPRNGQIKAMVGGKDFYNEEGNGQFNRATQAPRQPGSTFKTFVYATSIAAGISPYQGFLDAEYVVDGYKPKNYGNTYRNTYVSMRNALISSTNVVAVRALIDIGWEPTIEMAKKMGIKSELKPTYSLALGASEVTLLEITSAYGTLANKGVHQPAYGISRILDREGKVIYEADFTSTQALDEDSAAIVTWMLRGVVTSGTGQAAQIGRPVAGKTGTSDKSRDLWFIGYIPQVVTGVWLGNDDNSPTWGVSKTSAAVWRQFMREIVQEMPIESFSSLPNKLSGREGTIKAKPIKPKHSYYKKKKKTTSSTSTQTRRRSRSSTRANRSTTKRRTTQRTNRNTRRQPVQTRRQPVRNQTPRRRPAPPKPNPVPKTSPVQVTPVTRPSAPTLNKPKKPTAPVQARPVAPSSDLAPPAPPASRK